MADKTDSKLDARVSAANATLQSDRSKGIAQLREIIFAEGSEAETIKGKEQAIGSLTNALAEDGQAQSLEKLLAELKPLYDSMAKAKTAKIVRTVIDALARIPNTAELQVRSYAVTRPQPRVWCCSSTQTAACSMQQPATRLHASTACFCLAPVRSCLLGFGDVCRRPVLPCLQIRVCKEQIEWARQEKRNFLRQRIEMRLANLLMEVEDYQPALQLVDGLLTEVKKLDDKLLLVDVHLIESRLHHVLVNTPKSKAALTAARTAANAVYVPPGLQVCTLPARHCLSIPCHLSVSPLCSTLFRSCTSGFVRHCCAWGPWGQLWQLCASVSSDSLFQATLSKYRLRFISRAG